MSLTLEIVSPQSRGLGKDRIKTFGQDGGTIGRSLDNDWSLPDGQRFLSSRHASIDFRSGSYYIVDMSKNGVFINGADDAVGHGKPQRLFSGDRIRIGEYEMTVAIENVEDTRETLLDMSHVDPVDAKQRVDAPDPTSNDLVDAQVITGVGIEMFLEDDEAESLKPLYAKYRTGDSSSRIEAPGAKPAAPVKPAAPAKPAAPTPQSKSTPAAAPARLVKPAPARDKAGSATREPLEALFRGAGIDAPTLTPQQAEKLLTQIGHVMRELVVGVIDCLHLRALQKAQLKQSNTVIQARDNNRLKFSANFDEGFTRLFLDESDHYADPIESVRDAFSDIKDHQRTLLKAMRSALSEYLDRLEPQQIELRASNGRTGSLINAANRLKYWDMYKEVYAVLANSPADDMPQPFLEALASAYYDGTAKAAQARPGQTKREAS
ncbi:MAG TPA: type VI secretion system-associated FHA domain protein TagH [Gammaproteobacteria bacterium]|nr:type VI secretion system-associated FHA domain protein TagH [Gammaproteobacteria bacterium]